MTKKWIGINFLLLLVAAAFGWQLYDSVQQFEAENNLGNIEPDPALNQKLAQDTLLPTPLKDDFYSPLDFSIIPEKNVFIESRTKEDTGETPITTGSIPAAQKPQLVGVILTDKQKIASLLEPQARGRTRQIHVLQIGDNYEGYTISEIEADHVVLNNGSQKEIIALHDESQTTQRSRTSTRKTPRVIPVGALSTASGNAPIIVGSSGPTGPSRSAAARATPQPANAAAAGAAANIVLPAGGGIPVTQQPAEQENLQQPSTQSPTAAPNSGGTQGRNRVIRSPFGDIIRDP